MSDDRESNVVHLPPRGGASGSIPEAPDIGGFFFTDPPEEPPESPAEVTMELPVIPRPMDPEAALASEGIPAVPGADDESGSDSGEYVQRRSLAERLGDWLEYRIALGRSRMESEAPYAEAEIARKVELLNAKTSREVALLEQQNKLREAQTKARADRAGARSGTGSGSGGGKPSSGLGSDKGRGKTAPGPGGSGRGPGSGSRGRDSGSKSGATNPSKNPGKGPDRSAGGRHGAGGGKESGAGPKGRQNTSGSSGGPGKGGSRKEGGGKERKHSSGPSSERPNRRQEKAAARQQRHSAVHAAGLEDRSKDRDQARARQQKEWKDRRAEKAERDAARKAKKTERGAARKAKRDAAASADGPGRTTLGGAVSEEAQRRWDKRRADAKNDKAGAEKVSLTKDKGTAGKGRKDTEEGPDGASNAETSTPPTDEPGKESKAGDKPSDGAEKKNRRFRRRTRGSDRAGRRGRTGRTGCAGRAGRRGPGRPSDSPFGPPPTPTVEWPDHSARPPKSTDKAEDDIVDADIVPDAPAAMTTGVKGLPPAPDPHSARPGTSRPTSTEGSSVSSASVSKPSGQDNLAAQHRTNTTFDEYLVDIANIAVAAAADREHAEDLAQALGKVADALRDMAADLVGDHNIDTQVTNLVSDLADAAGRMKLQAERAAQTCEVAAEAAQLAAIGVARVYGEDMRAKEEGGAAHASSAAHH